MNWWKTTLPATLTDWKSGGREGDRVKPNLESELLACFVLECCVGVLVVLFHFLLLPLIERTCLCMGGCFYWGRWTEVCPEGGWQEGAGSLWSSTNIQEAVGRSRNESTSDRRMETEEDGHSLLWLRKSQSWPRPGCEAGACLHLLLWE